MVDNEVAGHQVNSIFDGAIAADHERIEDEPQSFLRQTWPVVAHLDFDLLLLRRGAIGDSGIELDATARRQAGDLILQHQLEQPIKLAFIDTHERQ